MIAVDDGAPFIMAGSGPLVFRTTVIASKWSLIERQKKTMAIVQTARPFLVQRASATKRAATPMKTSTLAGKSHASGVVPTRTSWIMEYAITRMIWNRANAPNKMIATRGGFAAEFDSVLMIFS